MEFLHKVGREIGFATLPIARFAERMAEVFPSSTTLGFGALTASLERIYAWYNRSADRPFSSTWSRYRTR